jgi:hypothetical protein
MHSTAATFFGAVRSSADADLPSLNFSTVLVAKQFFETVSRRRLARATLCCVRRFT